MDEVSRETLIERYFPEAQEAIRAYAHFLSTAGIERGLIGPREGERTPRQHRLLPRQARRCRGHQGQRKVHTPRQARSRTHPDCHRSGLAAG